MLILVLTICSFFLSLMGYALFLSEKYDIPYGYGISISASFIISALWIIGIFCSITLPIYVLFGSGLILLLYSFFKSDFRPSTILNWTNLFLILTVPFLFYFLHGRRFFFIDDFNHWAIIARSILEGQALPNAADELIHFVSYPPGSALWICYFLTIIGSSSEDMYLFAQAMLVLIYLCPITVNCCNLKNKSLIRNGLMLVVIFLLGSVCLLSGTQLLTLCVDGLLAAAGIGLICFILNYSGSLQKKIVFSIPLIISVLSIKDYGLLFSTSAVFLLFCSVQKNSHSVKERIILSFIPIATVFLMVFLWQTYVSQTFTHLVHTPHSLNVSRWASVFNSRSHNDILLISKLFIQAILGKRTIVLFLGLAFTLIVIWGYQHLVNDSRKNNTASILTFIVVNYVVYLCGLAFVYLFSMEIEGAIRLESYERYSGTEFCFLFGICISYLLDIVSTNNSQIKSEGKIFLNAKRSIPEWLINQQNTLILIVCICLVLLLSLAYSNPATASYFGSSRERVNTLTEEAYQGDAVIYAPSQMDGYYNEYMIVRSTAYDFRCNKIETATLDNVAEFEKILTHYSHILILDMDDLMQNYLYTNGWEGELAPGLYQICNGKIIPELITGNK